MGKVLDDSMLVMFRIPERLFLFKYCGTKAKMYLRKYMIHSIATFLKIK